MINGAHCVIFSQDAEADRAFLRDVLELPNVDVGDGWLIFKMPPAEIGVHPSDGATTHEISLMCDDLEATMADLTGKGIEFKGEVVDQGYGLVTYMVLPGGVEVQLYEPRRPTP